MTKTNAILPYAPLGVRRMSRLAVVALAFSLLPIGAVIGVNVYSYTVPRAPAGSFARVLQEIGLGILQYEVMGFSGAPALIAVVLAWIAIRLLRRSVGEFRGRNLAIVAIVLGGLETLGAAALWIEWITHQS